MHTRIQKDDVCTSGFGGLWQHKHAQHAPQRPPPQKKKKKKYFRFSAFPGNRHVALSVSSDIRPLLAQGNPKHIFTNHLLLTKCSSYIMKIFLITSVQSPKICFLNVTCQCMKPHCTNKFIIQALFIDTLAPPTRANQSIKLKKKTNTQTNKGLCNQPNKTNLTTRTRTNTNTTRLAYIPALASKHRYPRTQTRLSQNSSSTFPSDFPLAAGSNAF